eukprot:268150-Amphidinium_carterae.1
MHALTTKPLEEEAASARHHPSPLATPPRHLRQALRAVVSALILQVLNVWGKREAVNREAQSLCSRRGEFHQDPTFARLASCCKHYYAMAPAPRERLQSFRTTAEPQP